jgi:nickel-dependent lactate racemase
MTEIQLRYGQGFVDFAFDRDRFQILSADADDARPLTDQEIGDTLTRPIQAEPFDDLFSAGDSVLIVVSDATRATASGQLLNLMVRRLIQNGVSASDIAIIFATGIHRPVTPEEKIELLTPFIAQRIRTIDHHAHDASQHVNLGITRRGTPVEINRALTEFSHVVTTGGVGFHYFAGFTGGRKSICPGLASTRTIEATHLLALDDQTGGRAAGVGTALLDGNAVHEECEHVASLIAPRFAINTIVDDSKRAIKVYAGDWKAAHRIACNDYLKSHSLPIHELREVVIASCGGSPYDINLIQAHKALEMAAHACSEGGDIVLLAECRDGLGRANFLQWFEEQNSSTLVTRLFNHYEVNGQTACSLLTKAERYRVHLVSGLPESEVIRMRMIPAKSLGDALGKINRAGRGFIMPHGARFLPRQQAQ